MAEDIAKMAMTAEEHPELAKMFGDFMLNKVPGDIDRVLREMNSIIRGLVLIRDAVAEAQIVADGRRA